MDKKELNDISELYNNPLVENIKKIYLCFSSTTQKICITYENDNTYLHINKDYYQQHKEEIDSFIIYFIRKYKNKEINFGSGKLINDKMIEEICNNEAIKIVSLAKYGFFDKYSLSKKHYEMLKKANKELIKTLYIDKELEETFDPIIEFNKEKFLYSYYKYEDFQNNHVTFYSSIPEDKLYILKYLGENTDVIISTRCNIKEIIETLKKYNKNNKVIIEVKDKTILNQAIIDLGYLDSDSEKYDNIIIKLDGIKKVDISIHKYLEYEKILYSIVEPAMNMSPFEKYIYAYDIVKQFKKYNTPKKDNKNVDNLSNEEYTNIKSSSRDLYQILENDYIVCVGFAHFLSDLLTKLGIDNIELSILVDISSTKAIRQLDIPKEQWEKLTPEEKHKIITEQQAYIPKDDFSVHRRLMVYIKDEKYGIDGIYYSDPTWDNYLDRNIYAYAVMTEDDVSTSLSTNKLDDLYLLFSATNIEEFNAMLNTIMDKHARKRKKEYEEKKKTGLTINTNIINIDAIFDFHYVFNEFLGEFSKLFPEDVKHIKEKYPCLDEQNYGIINIYKMSYELKEAIYEIAVIIITKNNKKIDNEMLKSAISEVYKDVYEGGLKKEEIDKMIEDTERVRTVEFGPSKRTI